MYQIPKSIFLLSFRGPVLGRNVDFCEQTLISKRSPRSTSYSECLRSGLVSSDLILICFEVKNVGESDFPIKAASNYAVGEMVALPIEMPAGIE